MLGPRALVAPFSLRGVRGGCSGVRLAVTVGLVLAVVGGTAASYLRSLAVGRLIPGLQLQSRAVGSVDHDDLPNRVARIAREHLDQPILLEVGQHRLAVSRRKLGARIAVDETIQRLERLGKSGYLWTDLVHRLRARQGKLDVPLAATLDRQIALAYLARLKSTIDRAAVAPRLDLEAGKVLSASEGYRLRMHDALAAAEVAIRQGAIAFDLPVAVVKLKGRSKLAGLVVRHVLGEFETVFSLADKDHDRAFNLKVGAAKLDGTIIGPKQQMSFNKTVGPRTRAEGYRTATVISQGELVDGMAGGACQLSSTLFAAAFFAGLDLLSSRPHTMPSSYIKMGLDAAVAYPTTDLVIRNPYPFPVALHYRVSRGRVKVQVRGQRRPWRKVTFRRTLKEKTPFKEIIRDDPSLPRGARVVAQSGVLGFTFERERLFFGARTSPERSEKRTIRYPSTTRIVRRGTGTPDPAWKPPPSRPGFRGVPESYTLTH